jgi:hypothetical protein
MDEQTELLREIVELLRLIAEPAIATRDEKRRAALSEIVGRGKSKAKAVSLMDGQKNQATICKEAGIDQGALSRLTKALRTAGLIANDDKPPKLVIPLPPNFMENLEKVDA